ncbi:MAG: hypothetical protein IKR11_01215 [Solobacterium sp.]|nr:hypothetical protein [Solobacterium sp.]
MKKIIRIFGILCMALCLLACNTKNQKDALTKEQALEAVKNYCFETNPELKNLTDSETTTIYWDATVNEDQKIVVLYRSYTGAEIRFYIDPVSGETYTTELVPGIIDEEKRTDENLNVRDYLD